MNKTFEKDVREMRKKQMDHQTYLKHQRLFDEKAAASRITGKSLGFLVRDQPALHRLQASEAFEWSISVLILVHCVVLEQNALLTPKQVYTRVVMLIELYLFVASLVAVVLAVEGHNNRGSRCSWPAPSCQLVERG